MIGMTTFDEWVEQEWSQTDHELYARWNATVDKSAGRNDFAHYQEWLEALAHLEVVWEHKIFPTDVDEWLASKAEPTDYFTRVR